MSTLPEIEAAARRLPLQEQQELVRVLSERLRRRPAPLGPAERKEWLAELQTLSDTIGTGQQALNVEDVLEELREERS
jgi:hypothetical protein